MLYTSPLESVHLFQYNCVAMREKASLRARASMYSVEDTQIDFANLAAEFPCGITMYVGGVSFRFSLKDGSVDVELRGTHSSVVCTVQV